MAYPIQVWTFLGRNSYEGYSKNVKFQNWQYFFWFLDSIIVTNSAVSFVLGWNMLKTKLKFLPFFQISKFLWGKPKFWNSENVVNFSLEFQCFYEELDKTIKLGLPLSWKHLFLETWNLVLTKTSFFLNWKIWKIYIFQQLNFPTLTNVWFDALTS
jgi:hypothetical protein